MVLLVPFSIFGEEKFLSVICFSSKGTVPLRKGEQRVPLVFELEQVFFFKFLCPNKLVPLKINIFVSGTAC